MKNFFAALCGVLLAVACAMASLCLLMDGAGSSPQLMHALMRRCTTPEETGLPQEHYLPMTVMITDYLSGRAEEFQYSWTDRDGVTYLGFRGHEQQHMRDVRDLFILARTVLAGCVLAIALLGLCAWRLKCRRHVCGGFLGGVGCLLAVLAGLAAWGIADFGGLFVLFHRLSFTNDLWLLDPRTDLLIRLMPTDFFVHYAAILGGTWLALLLLLGAAAWIVCRMVKTNDL